MTIEDVSICFNYEISGESEFKRQVDTICSLNTPDEIKNRIIESGGDDPFSTEVGLGVTGEGNPIDSYSNSLLFNTYPNNKKGHVHVWADPEYIDAFQGLFNNIVNILGGGEIGTLTYNMILDSRFEDLNLDLSVKLPDGSPGEIYQETGVRFDLGDEDTDYLLQQNPGEDTSSLRYSKGSIAVDSQPSESLIEDHLEDANELIEAI